MADQHIVNARIKSKYDTLEHWINSSRGESPFIPLKGELCIVEIPNTSTRANTQSDNQDALTPPAIAIKVGDGEHTFVNLPWIQGLAGDVYAWAKGENPPAASAISTIRKDSAAPTDESKWSTTNVEAWLQALTDDINGLSGGAGSISTQIATALSNLDVDNDASSELSHHITGFGANQTLATLTETDGYVTATFQPIEIAESQVTGLETDLNAKAPLDSPDLIGIPTAPTANAGTGTQQIATTAFVKTAVENATMGLSGAMHYKGVVEAKPTVTPPSGTYESGDVVTNGISEYVFDGTNWRELGTEGSYALDTVTITSGEGLEGGGALSSDQTISHSIPTGAVEGSKGISDARTYVKTITTDKFGHVTAVTTGTETVTDTTYTFAEGSVDGAFSVTPSTGSTESVAIHGLKAAAYKEVEESVTAGSSKLPTSDAVATAIAASKENTSIYELKEGSETTASDSTIKYFIIDCGTASELID